LQSTGNFDGGGVTVHLTIYDDYDRISDMNLRKNAMRAYLDSDETMARHSSGLWTPATENEIDQHQRRPYALLVQERGNSSPPPEIVTKKMLGDAALALEAARVEDDDWPDMDRLIESISAAKVGDQSPVSRFVLGTLKTIVLARPVWLESPSPDRAAETEEDRKVNLILYAAEKLRLLAATGTDTIDLVREYQGLSASPDELSGFLASLPDNPFLRGGARQSGDFNFGFSGATMQVDNLFLERLIAELNGISNEPESSIDEDLATPPGYPYHVLNGPHKDVVCDETNRVVIV
jgi:hypothetical protein